MKQHAPLQMVIINNSAALLDTSLNEASQSVRVSTLKKSDEENSFLAQYALFPNHLLNNLTMVMTDNPQNRSSVFNSMV